jgi:predicted alpha/beta-fold hydrolase
MTARAMVPRFEPHPWVRGPHAQTIAGVYLPGPRIRLETIGHVLPLGDGDALSLLETRPRQWRPGDPAAVLIHGLGGDARSPYIVRMASRLSRAGVRVVRLNLRGAGSGFGLARGVYHAGRSDDIRRAVEWLAADSPGSPVALVGYSLGASLALKLAAEAVAVPANGLDCVIAANPPLDLAACSRHIQRPGNRLYDRHFVNGLKAGIARLHRRFPDLGPTNLGGVRTLYDFDDRYTARRAGFVSADEYYARSSVKGRIADIRLPGLVVHAADDPFIPVDAFLEARFPPRLGLELVPRGGHLGYLSRQRWGPDRRWLDARIEAWMTERWGLATANGPRQV